MSAGGLCAIPIVLIALGMSGCATPQAGDAAGQVASATAAPPPAPTDPLLIFAAASGPGSSGVVEGQTVRVARAYVSAGGRDCRELLIGGGIGERSAVACRDELTGWALARPLLRGSGPGRP